METLPDPINDLNEATDSCSTELISKLYMAINDEYYIQLFMCNFINYKYFCKELFIVKHMSKHSCQSAIFFLLLLLNLIVNLNMILTPQ